jgi:hypothetical protein
MGEPFFLSTIEWEAFSPLDRAIRVHYATTGAFELAEVELRESAEDLTLTLYERVDLGAEALPRVFQCVDVDLQEAVGPRRVWDGATGHRCRPLATNPPQAEEDWFHARAANAGCQAWRAPTRFDG